MDEHRDLIKTPCSAMDARNVHDDIMIEKSELAAIKDLVEQMMMELRFRGLGDDHELVREALETGRWIGKKLRGTD